MPLNYILSQKGFKHLEHDGFEFLVDQLKPGYTNWKCVEYKKRKCLGNKTILEVYYFYNRDLFESCVLIIFFL